MKKIFAVKAKLIALLEHPVLAKVLGFSNFVVDSDPSTQEW